MAPSPEVSVLVRSSLSSEIRVVFEVYLITGFRAIASSDVANVLLICTGH